jgi:membrane protein implicated in regulation of membrane protease activity
MFTYFWAFVTAWYNVPFTLLLVGAGMLAALQLIGLGADDGDTDAENDLDQDIDADADAGADPDTDAGVNDQTALSWLAYFGIGKAPLFVVLLLLFSSIGGTGWLINGLIGGAFGTYPGLAFGAALPLALLAGGALGARAALAIGRNLPPVSTTASRAQALVGQVGKVISPFVDGHYGLVHLRSPGGTLISVFAVTDFDEPIRRGEAVVLVSYDEQQRRYIVTRAGPSELGPP